ncbi:MAG: hypothetical protein AAGE05_04275 [Pseudomonadota bacterium]
MGDFIMTLAIIVLAFATLQLALSYFFMRLLAKEYQWLAKFLREERKSMERTQPMDRECG